MNPKFRVYHIDSGQMFSVREMIFNGDRVKAVRIVGTITNDRYRKTNFLLSHQFKLMQYSGLSDKDGKPIADGDILRLGCYPYDDEDDTTKYESTENVEVNFNDGCFSISADHYEFWGEYSSASLSMALDDDNSELEVIGNMYQNPELLYN